MGQRRNELRCRSGLDRKREDEGTVSRVTKDSGSGGRVRRDLLERGKIGGDEDGGSSNRENVCDFQKQEYIMVFQPQRREESSACYGGGGRRRNKESLSDRTRNRGKIIRWTDLREANLGERGLGFRYKKQEGRGNA